MRLHYRCKFPQLQAAPVDVGDLQLAAGGWFQARRQCRARHEPDATSTDVPSNTSVASPGQAIELSNLVSASDADNDAVSYLFYDSTSGGGYFEVNGVVKQAGTIFAVAASQLSQVKFVPAQIGDSDDLLIGATDGKFSGWSSLRIDGPSGNTAPVVTVPNQSDAFVYLFYDAIRLRLSLCGLAFAK